jgi:arylsulfatase A-like enzyme
MEINSIKIAGGLVLTAICSFLNGQDKPNILFILSDDHAPEAISAYGRSMINTPNIDRIAKNGIRFTNCFAVSSICAPSRACLISGKCNALNGVLRIGGRLDGNQTTFPKVMQEAGYQTAIMGKWHLVSQPTGFDYYSVPNGMGTYYDCRLKSTGETWTDNGQGKEIMPGFFTDAITDKAINWLEKRDKNKPFCLLLHHKAPHSPYKYPEKYDSIFKNRDLPLPLSFNDDYRGKNSTLVNNPCTQSKLQYIKGGNWLQPKPQEEYGTEKYKKEVYQTIFKGYYRLVAGLDENIGRILDYLETSGLDKNTIVIYSSDNGYFMGEHGFFNKQWMYEESLRIPLIISLPGKKNKGKVIDKLVSELDIPSTIINYANYIAPSDFQGSSLKPLIEGKEINWRKSHFYHYYSQFEVPDNYGLRTEKYKLFCVVDPNNTLEWEFYNLKLDPLEMQNQVNNPVYAKTIDSLKVELNNVKNKYESVTR